jgi:hypothetical protein
MTTELYFSVVVPVASSLFGAVVGFALSYFFMRRSVKDAVLEHKAVYESDEMRQALIALKPLHADDLDRVAAITMNSGDKLFLQRVEHVGMEVSRLVCTTPSSVNAAVAFVIPAKGVIHLVRTREIASIVPDPKYAKHLDGQERGDDRPDHRTEKNQ